MLLDLFSRIYLTPENITGAILSILGIIGLCCVFHMWNEKWWKSLIPFYGTFILYKHTWKRYKTIFVVQTLLDLIRIRSHSIIKDNIKTNIFSIIKNCIETGEVDLAEIQFTELIIYILICDIIMIIIRIIQFVLKIITYLRIYNTFNIRNTLIKIGIVVFPDLFLLIAYLYKRAEVPKERRL